MKASQNRLLRKFGRGWTLVEMLVVVGMIGSLAAISFPVYKSIQKKVEKQQLEMMLTSLVSAVDNFETEYNYLPYNGSSYPTDEILRINDGDVTAVTTILTATESVKNFRQIVFFECEEAEGSPGNYKNGLVISGGMAKLYLAHGREFDRLYMDYNADNTLVYPYDLSKTVEGKTFMYYSFGPDNIWNTKPDNIANFE